nr:MAG TPA: hypothetical protein [Caudoviricetes sp.]
MKPNTLYQKIRRVSSAAAEILFIPYMATVSLTAYTSWASAYTGAPLPAWWTVGMWITFSVPAFGILAGIARLVRKTRTPARLGTITPDAICTILKKKG